MRERVVVAVKRPEVGAAEVETPFRLPAAGDEIDERVAVFPQGEAHLEVAADIVWHFAVAALAPHGPRVVAAVGVDLAHRLETKEVGMRGAPPGEILLVAAVFAVEHEHGAGLRDRQEEWMPLLWIPEMARHPVAIVEIVAESRPERVAQRVAPDDPLAFRNRRTVDLLAVRVPHAIETARRPVFRDAGLVFVRLQEGGVFLRERKVPKAQSARLGRPLRGQANVLVRQLGEHGPERLPAETGAVPDVRLGIGDDCLAAHLVELSSRDRPASDADRRRHRRAESQKIFSACFQTFDSFSTTTIP